jgi:hypothetical protein
MDASRYRSVPAVFSLKSMLFQLECLGFVYTLKLQRTLQITQ